MCIPRMAPRLRGSAGSSEGLAFLCRPEARCTYRRWHLLRMQQCHHQAHRVVIAQKTIISGNANYVYHDYDALQLPAPNLSFGRRAGKNAFPETPERRRAELVVFCLALRDAVIELCTHVVKRKIRKEIHLFVAQLRDRGFFAQLRVREFDCVKRRGMAKGAPYLTEKRLSFRDRAGAS